MWFGTHCLPATVCMYLNTTFPSSSSFTFRSVSCLCSYHMCPVPAVHQWTDLCALHHMPAPLPLYTCRFPCGTLTPFTCYRHLLPYPFPTHLPRHPGPTPSCPSYLLVKHTPPHTHHTYYLPPPPFTTTYSLDLEHLKTLCVSSFCLWTTSSAASGPLHAATHARARMPRKRANAARARHARILQMGHTHFIFIFGALRFWGTHTHRAHYLCTYTPLARCCGICARARIAIYFTCTHAYAHAHARMAFCRTRA